MEGKRRNENHNSHHDEIEELPEKMEQFELDDSDDESSLCVAPDLEYFVRIYMRKHVGDESIKERVLLDNPVLGKIDKHPL